jgi:hypothetical protein
MFDLAVKGEWDHSSRKTRVGGASRHLFTLIEGRVFEGASRGGRSPRFQKRRDDVPIKGHSRRPTCNGDQIVMSDCPR